MSYDFLVVNCEWGAWTNGSCSETCGTGELIKTRTKTIVEAHGGACSGQSDETVSCYMSHCPSNTFSNFEF